MTDRTISYYAFSFLVKLSGLNGSETTLGGFSDISGLGMKTIRAEYRNGNEHENHVPKVACQHKVNNVTLKRGIIKSTDLCNWLAEARRSVP